VTAIKGFEAYKNENKKRIVQNLLHKDFAIKANALKNNF